VSTCWLLGVISTSIQEAFRLEQRNQIRIKPTKTIIYILECHWHQSCLIGSKRNELRIEPSEEMEKLVETRMDISTSQSTSSAMTDRINRPAVRKPPTVDSTNKTQSIQADVAKIFAKRAFQAGPVEKTQTIAPIAGNPRGQRLDITV
jgi:hypothetical protein